MSISEPAEIVDPPPGARIADSPIAEMPVRAPSGGGER